MIVAAVVVVALLVVAAVAVARVVRAPLPRTRGKLTVDGLHAEVSVYRDKRGVAHVDARSMEDAAFAMGLVHAQERLWQLDLSRRVAAGRISEIAGADGLLADRFLRRVGLRRAADVEARLLDAETQVMLEAYAAGINTVISSDRTLPVEFTMLKITPERWQPVDSIACAKLLALGLGVNWDVELQRLRLVRELGPDVAARVDLTYPDSNPTILGETVSATAGTSAGAEVQALYQEAARWLPSAMGASNSWVLAPTRTATGRAMLANDPHLEPTLPSPWYAAHVRAGSDFETTGVTFPGQPFPLIGHNRRIAWGYTNSYADCQDLVVEGFDTPAAARYRTETGWQPSLVVREVIRVKDSSDEVEEVVITRHGPVVERCDDTSTGRWLGLALQWTALPDPTGLTTPGQASRTVLDLQRAHDWESFRAAFDGLDAPSQNAVYADVEGHIGYFCNGRIPVRQRQPSGLPTVGWNGEARWLRYLTRDEAPQQLDPADGLVVTANNRIVGADFPHYISRDYMAGYRARRLHELLDREALTLDDMRAVQLDLVSLPAVTVSGLLANVRCRGHLAEWTRRRLMAWDGRMAADRIEPTMYEAFMLRLAEHALRPLCGDSWAVAAGVDLGHPVFGYPGLLTGRVTPLLLERWAADDADLLEGATWPEVAGLALEAAVADLQKRAGRPRPRRWGWGRQHELRLQHPLGVRRLTRLMLNAPGITVGGSTDSVFATGHRPGHDFHTTLFAPSWRQVFDVGNWDSGCSGVLYPGQSGHRASRHHHDLSKDWLANRQFPLGWGDDAFRGRRRLRLIPKPRALVPVRASL